MKKTLILIFIFLPILAFSKGRDGNASGGYWINDADKKPVTQKEIENSLKFHKIRFVKKNIRENFYLEVPKAFENLLKIKVQINEEIINVDPEVLAMDKELLDAYNYTIYGLYRSIDQEGKSVLLHLLEKISKLEGKPTIVVHKNYEIIMRKNISKGDYVLMDYGFFDEDNELVFIGPRFIQEFDTLESAERPIQGVLRHEFANYFMKLVLGEKYPKGSVWHDLDKLRETPFRNFSDAYMYMKTDEKRAFVEGVAHAIESVDSFDNPYIGRHSSLNYVLDDREAEIYGAPMGQMMQSLQILPSSLFGFDRDYIYDVSVPKVIESELSSNEAYVGKSIIALFLGLEKKIVTQHAGVSFEIDDQRKILTEGFSMNYMEKLDEKKIISIIDILYSEKITNVQSLAKAIDKKWDNRFGWAWLRQYFFYDYKSSQEILSSEVTDVKEYRQDRFYTFNHKNRNTLYFPLLRSGFEQTYKGLFNNFVDNYSYETVRSIYLEKFKKFESVWKESKQKFKLNKTILPLYKKAMTDAKKLKIQMNGGDYKKLRKPFNDFCRGVYQIDISNGFLDLKNEYLDVKKDFFNELERKWDDPRIHGFDKVKYFLLRHLDVLNSRCHQVLALEFIKKVNKSK